MPEVKPEKTESNSLNQIVQELISGSVRRHTFSQWELELLLDLQTCRVRKSARPEVLRRYLRAVQHHFAKGAQDPLRLSEFLDNDNQYSRMLANVPELQPAS